MRPWLRQLHLWLGLIAGLVIVALGLSGSALVFRAEIERFAVRAWLRADATPARTLDELVAAARAR